MPRRLIISTLAALGLALACSSAALATPQLVQDADEPDIPQDRDIEWVSVDHPPSTTGQWVRHTVKFRAPYAGLPCIGIKTSPSRTYKLYRGKIYGSGLSSTRVIVSRTPAGAPDTASYSFNLGVIGNPSSYEWFAWNCEAYELADRAPDGAEWLEHWIGPAFEPVLP